MSEKPETSTYFFDEKKSEYYRNRALNNCKTRIRYLSKLKNQFNSCINTLKMMNDLENNKDHNYTEITEIKDMYNSVTSMESDIETISNMLSEEYTKILSTDFESIIQNNVEKIRNIENSKNHEEIYKKDEEI